MKVLSLFDGKYEISDDGKVFSNVGKRKELIGKVGKYGYRMVVLNVNKKRLYPNVHRLVAKAFIPNPNGYLEVNHKDGNKINNSADNLEWVTTSQNLVHCRDNIGSTMQKINMGIATEIRTLYKTGRYTQKQIGEMFGIKKTEVGYIIQNKRWSA